MHPRDDVKHAASQLAEFVEILTDIFLDIDEDQQRRTICSVLLTTLFGSNPSCTDSEAEPSGLKAISALHRRGLESLADCVEPFHLGIDSTQSIPRSPLVIQKSSLMYQLILVSRSVNCTFIYLSD